LNFIPNTGKQIEEMMQSIGIKSIDELFVDIPEKILLKQELNLPEALSEQELLAELEKISSKNTHPNSVSYFLGAGSYNHYIPAAVPFLVMRSEFYTAYTPYQPEISQGMLQAIYEFQSLICSLTGMDVANASMYDGASALGEAMIMSCNITKRKKLLVSKSIHPQYRETLSTYSWAHGAEIKEISFDKEGITFLEELKKEISEEIAAVMVQYPNFFGCVEDLEEIGKIAHEKGALFVVAITEPLALGLIEAPGKFGADIVLGEGQSFGNPMSYGGPGVGFMAVKNEFVRQIPGRLVGRTTDKEGKRGFIMTLQAREQHIRREKSSSNICSNEALAALASAVYLTLLGKSGLSKMAELNAQKANYLYEKLFGINGIKKVFNGKIFNEFVVKVKDAKEIQKKLLKENIVAGYDLGNDYKELENCLLFCVTEMNSPEQIEKLIGVLK